MSKRSVPIVGLTLVVAVILVLSVTSSVNASSRIVMGPSEVVAGNTTTVAFQSVAAQTRAVEATIVEAAAVAAEMALAEITEYAVITTVTTALGPNGAAVSRRLVTGAEMRKMAKDNFD